MASHSFLVETWSDVETDKRSVTINSERPSHEWPPLLYMTHGRGPAAGYVHVQAGAIAVRVPWMQVQDPVVHRCVPGDLQMSLGPVEINLDAEDFLEAYREAVEWLAECPVLPRAMAEREAAQKMDRAESYARLANRCAARDNPEDAEMYSRRADEYRLQAKQLLSGEPHAGGES